MSCRFQATEIVSYILSKIILDPKTSRRIFELAKIQQDELDALDEDEGKTEERQERTARIPSDDEDEDSEDLEDVDEDVEEIFVRFFQMISTLILKHTS